MWMGLAGGEVKGARWETRGIWGSLGLQLLEGGGDEKRGEVVLVEVNERCG